MIKEINYKELLYDADLSGLSPDYHLGAIGQERACEAIKVGLGIKKKGYNILAVGSHGCGRTAFAEMLAKEQAEKEPVPSDICCVYNFKNPKKPVMLEFPPGEGGIFKSEISELVHTLTVEIPKAYATEQYESEKEVLLKEIQSKRDEAVKLISDKAREEGFSVKNAGGGLTFTPLIDGKAITDEEYDSLSKEERDDFSRKSDLITESADGFIKEVKAAESEIKKEIYEIDYNVGLFTIGRFFSPLQGKYRENEKTAEYLKNLKEDILSNLDYFTENENDEPEDLMAALIPFAPKKNTEEVIQRYDVNLLVDNSSLTGAPVVVSYNPTYAGLVGEVEFDNEFGNYTTDYMKIVPGLFHKANGGYLILQLTDILASPYGWETVKKVLRTGEITIEPIKDYQFSAVSISTLKPEAVKYNGKIIIVCSSYYYQILTEADDDTEKLFKIAAFFDYEMAGTSENLSSLLGYIKAFPKINDTKEFDPGAVNEIIKYSKRLSERKDKLTAIFSKLNDVMTEADYIASGDNKDVVGSEHIIKAVKNGYNRTSIYEDKLSEMYSDGDMLIDVTGAKVGQVNGLSVIEAYGCTFGKPSRITATTYIGKAGIVNIEKESELSGEIHTKGVNVISGYMGSKYAKDFPLSFSCRLCFEQNYGGVDGDSASSTEIYAILSGLSELPLRQDIAVTGSVNQFGEIQPIGGVTYKVEGFYETCKNKGLTGTQGVMIPKQNIKELVLSDEVIEAVKNGTFKLYAIETIDDGIEILTGLKAAEVHKKVYNRLKSYYEKLKED
ncbi:MAG: AAA family ATPase [Clostridiales bacterium]|nr:AAA family ATPase [Clostridiales bacterium]